MDVRAARTALLAGLLIFSVLWTSQPAAVKGWGSDGHEIAGRAAAMKLPREMPAFFRSAVDQLGFLNNEPDRWRDRAESSIDKAMDQAFAPDHFLDLEEIPSVVLGSVNRYDYAEEVFKLRKKPWQTGFAPYRILELFQRMRVAFRLWRAETEAKKRKWIEQRIVNDGGIMGHYVADLSNPLHTTIHYNGWVGANPNGYTPVTREYNQGFHYRFEEEFVKSKIQLKDVAPGVSEQGRAIEKPREEILKYLRDSNALVEQTYILDKRERFNAATASPEHKKFVAGRLAAGAGMLRDLWWTAYVTSDPALTPKPKAGTN
jgi:hypothetical protein